jgi:hypothetical protein
MKRKLTQEQLRLIEMGIPLMKLMGYQEERTVKLKMFSLKKVRDGTI